MCPPMFRETKCKSSLENYTRNPNFKRNPTHKVPLEMTHKIHTEQDRTPLLRVRKQKERAPKEDSQNIKYCRI